MKRLLTVILILMVGMVVLPPTMSKDKATYTKKTVYDKDYYIKLAKTVSKKYGIKEWHILYGLWWWESGGVDYPKHTARGDGGRAYGIGQVHLATARGHYRKDITAKELMIPEVNAHVSAKILSDLLKDKDLRKASKKWKNPPYIYALAAYNLDIAKVKSAIKKGKLPPNYFSYVNNVLQRATSF